MFVPEWIEGAAGEEVRAEGHTAVLAVQHYAGQSQSSVLYYTRQVRILLYPFNLASPDFARSSLYLACPEFTRSF